MRSKWWSNVKEIEERRFIEIVKKCDFKKNGKKNVEVLVELKGEYYILLGLSLN